MRHFSLVVFFCCSLGLAFMGGVLANDLPFFTLDPKLQPWSIFSTLVNLCLGLYIATMLDPWKRTQQSVKDHLVSEVRSLLVIFEEIERLLEHWNRERKEGPKTHREIGYLFSKAGHQISCLGDQIKANVAALSPYIDKLEKEYARCWSAVTRNAPFSSQKVRYTSEWALLAQSAIASMKREIKEGIFQIQRG